MRNQRAQSAAAINGASLEAALDCYHGGLKGWFVARQYPESRGREVIGNGLPDYLAVSRDRAVCFDAKSYTGVRWPVSLVKPHQAEALDRFQSVGVSAIYLRLPTGDRWLSWEVVGPVFWRWWDTREEGWFGGADGVGVVGCDWVSVVCS